MKSGMTVLVVGMTLGVAAVVAYIIFMHSLIGSRVPFQRELMTDVVGTVAILWIAWKVTAWVLTRSAGTGGASAP